MSRSVKSAAAQGPFAATADALEKLTARCRGFYALNVYLPLWAMSRAWHERLRALRGVRNRHVQATRLPQVAWSALFPRSPICLVATARHNGNIRLGELAVLAQAAAAAPPGSEIVEIGTFDGRTTINLAINAPQASSVFTLDLPSDQSTQFALADGERHFVDKPSPGERFRSCGPHWRNEADRIVQLLGDSATFDWSAHVGKAGLVFVDGSHSYDYVRRDSDTAFRLVARGGTVLWHDYGVWEDVTRGLEELDAERTLGLRQIRGTSLVVWRGL
jgi:Methyltransferase domain